MKITVRLENVYGNKCIYPVCEQAKLFADIAKQKTLNNSINQIQQLGYDVVVQAPEI